MGFLIDGAIERSRMVLAVMVCALIAGLVTYIKLPKEADPDIQMPFVGVTIPLEGIAPEDAERLLVRPTEVELQTVEGLKEMNAFALEGAAQFMLEFEITADVDQAIVDVREAIDMAKRWYPEETREPVITEVNASLFPVLMINLYGDIPERGLYRIARDLKDKLETHSGVLEANISGEREELLEIVIDPVKLETYNISPQQILQIVSANNRLIPAGRIDTGEGSFAIKVPGLIETAQDAYDLPVKQSGEAVVTLKDVAEIRRTFKDREIYARFNGQPAVSISVVKRTGANILHTVADVRAIIEEEQTSWPSTLEVGITSDMSETIADQLGQLQSSIATAIILVMIIVVGALGLRSASLVGISIPASFVMAFLLLGAFGYTVNMMVMFGLVIAVGILVDGAIVIVEYGDRKMAEGLSSKEAFAMAGKRMFWPIVASNATTLAAFIPFLFWNSMPGKFMAYLPITLIFVLTSSLIMALIFLPVLGGIVGGRAKDESGELDALKGDGGDPLKARGWIGAYAKLISNLIKRPVSVTAGAIGLVIAIGFWFTATPHKSEFFLNVEPEQLYVFVRAQGNLSADEQYAIVQRAEDTIFTVPGIKSLTTRAGSGAGSGNIGDGASDIPVDTVGRILVDLDTKSGRNGRETEAEIRERLSTFVGGRIEVKELEQGPPVGKDIQILLRSNDRHALYDVAEEVSSYLSTMDGLVEVEDTRPLPGTEWRLTVDREQAARFGADVAQVGAVVQLVSNGVLVGRYRPDDANEEVDIRVRYPADQRTVESLDSLRLTTPGGAAPISAFVDRKPAPSVSKIERKDGKRVLTVRANAAEQGAGMAMTAQIKDWISEQNFDRSVDITFAGADQENAEAGAFFVGAAAGALFLMAVILLWEFNNFYHVLLTLTAVILSTAGVMIGLNVASDYISIIMTGTGVVALAGIVVNNNIVLIDTFQRLHADGRSAVDAAVATAAQRIRPILLTTGTTICGLLPMMLQMDVNFSAGSIGKGGSASEWWVPLATAVVFGLGFSTVMTLLVTPVWLTAPAKLGAWRDRLLRAVQTRRFQRGEQPTDEMDAEAIGDNPTKPPRKLEAAE